MSHAPRKVASKKAPNLLSGHVILKTTSHQAGCETTTRIWSKHKSAVLGGEPYQSTISRLPIGQSHLSFVDCRVPMEVAADGHATRVFVYLPMEGSMEIQAAGHKLRAVPGGPAIVPPKTKLKFRATAIRCLMLEVPARKLRAELGLWEVGDSDLSPLALAPEGADALALAGLLEFAAADLGRVGGSVVPPLHLARLEAHLIAVLARVVAGNTLPMSGTGQHIGHLTLAEIDAWLRSRLQTKFELLQLASAAGVTMRALQKGFLRHFHTTPHALVRDLRLDAARERFLDPSCRETITQMAGRFQFPHLGRFASGYHARFGETPSQSLQHRGK